MMQTNGRGIEDMRQMETHGNTRGMLIFHERCARAYQAEGDMKNAAAAMKRAAKVRAALLRESKKGD